MYKTTKEKYVAAIQDIRECHERGQPVLVGTVSIEKSEILAAKLAKRKLPHEVLNARNHEREALARLEQEGLVRTVPRRGVYVARKSKTEILEMITVWAALESMAARLITERATDGEIAWMKLPLNFSVSPEALWLIRPEAPAPERSTP